MAENYYYFPQWASRNLDLGIRKLIQVYKWLLWSSKYVQMMK